MKSIELYTAATDNAGARCDAGAILVVGKVGDQIAADRAAALVEAGSAVHVPAPEREKAAK